MRKRYNEFILIIYIAPRKMADFERRKLEIGLEFGHLSFDKRINFSKGSSGPKIYVQKSNSSAGGRQPHGFLTQITCFLELLSFLHLTMLIMLYYYHENSLKLHVPVEHLCYNHLAS